MANNDEKLVGDLQIIFSKRDGKCRYYANTGEGKR